MLRHLKVRRPALSALASVAVLFGAVGCGATWDRVDPNIAFAARRAVAMQEFPPLEAHEREEFADERAKGTIGQAILGELLAIFPGLIVPGTGHFYAGDRKTARQLFRVGEFGYLLTGIGAGLFYGGLEASDADLHGLGVTLYASGGIMGGAGLFYVMTAWFYDMIDTPRAVLSGGEPPPRSRFVDSLDFFE